MNKIAIDFVAGSHGNYLETVCNQGFNIVAAQANFTPAGTSHIKSKDYNSGKLFDAQHWFELPGGMPTTFDYVVSIKFSKDDLLLLSSVSLLRSGDFKIDNDSLDVDTVSKLSRLEYKDTLNQIYQAYPDLDQSKPDIPRYILREFYKFGFRDCSNNGYWLKQKQMSYRPHQQVFEFDYSSFYDVDRFVNSLKDLAAFLDMPFEFGDWLYNKHRQFLSFIPYISHRAQCDYVIDCVKQRTAVEIPKLTLFQESYINGSLENIFNKEMPFYQENYFTSTQDMLYYLDKQAPNL